MTKYPVVSLHHAKGCELELVLTKSMKKLKQCTYDSPSAVPSGRLLSKAKFATPGLPSRPSSVPPATRGHSRDTQPAPRSPAGTPLSTRHRLPSPGREGRPAWKSRCAPSFARGPVRIPSPSRVTRGPRFPPSSWATRGPRFPPPSQLNSRAFSALSGNLPLLARIWSRARPWPIARGGEWRSCSDWPGRVARSFR